MLRNKHNELDEPWGKSLFDKPDKKKKAKAAEPMKGHTTSDVRCWPRNGGYRLYRCHAKNYHQFASRDNPVQCPVCRTAVEALT